MLELFQFTEGCPLYSQISNSARGEDPLSFGKYVNIRAILRKIGKIPI